MIPKLPNIGATCNSGGVQLAKMFLAASDIDLFPISPPPRFDDPDPPRGRGFEYVVFELVGDSLKRPRCGGEPLELFVGVEVDIRLGYMSFRRGDPWR